MTQNQTPNAYDFKNDLERKFAKDLRTIFQRRASLTDKVMGTWSGFFERADDNGVIQGVDKSNEYLDTLTSAALGYVESTFKNTPFASVFKAELTDIVQKYVKNPKDKSLTDTDLEAVEQTLELVKNIAGIDLERLYSEAEKNGELTMAEIEGTFGRSKDTADRYSKERSAVRFSKGIRSAEDMPTTEAAFREFHPSLGPVVDRQDLLQAMYGKLERTGADYEVAKPLIYGLGSA